MLAPTFLHLRHVCAWQHAQLLITIMGWRPDQNSPGLSRLLDAILDFSGVYDPQRSPEISHTRRLFHLLYASINTIFNVIVNYILFIVKL
jgi:hypothetical protein